MIPSQSTKVTYRGDGKTTVFPFTFPYISGNDVKVAIYKIATDETILVKKDYFVDTVGNTVTYPGYPPGQAINPEEQPPILTNAYKLVIYRETPVTQEVDLGEKYPLETLERMDDKGTLIDQEIIEILERRVKLDVGSELTSKELLDKIFSSAALAQKAAALAEEYAKCIYNKVMIPHNHDERYYTETEVDNKLTGKANLSGAAFSGNISAPTITANTTLNIPGGKIWIK